MNTISTKGLLLRIFTPTATISLLYLLLGFFAPFRTCCCFALWAVLP